MTTAPTPSDAERLARGLEEGFCGYAAWLQPVAAELRRLQADNERLHGDYALRGAQIQRMAALIDELEARKQLPPDALADKCEAWLQAGGAANIVDAFEAGYRAAEET